MKNPSHVLISFIYYTLTTTRCIETEPDETPKLPNGEDQTELIDLLYRQLDELGVLQSYMSKLGDGSLVVELPATEGCKNAPHVVLGAHVDISGEVHPIVHGPYKGGDLTLPNKGMVIVTAADLIGLEGQTIVAASGDKAGIVEIMIAMLTILVNHHGPLTIIFFKASFIEFLDPNKVATWDVFYTLNGLEAGTIDISCSNGGEEQLEHHPHHVNLAQAAIKSAGLKSVTRWERESTGGAMLNPMLSNVPCIKLGTGDRKRHQKTEFVVVEEMEAMVTAIIDLIDEYARTNKSEF
ncbi:MAG: hypothetical protein WCT28_03330 [Patescibacteria group bacterium]